MCYCFCHNNIAHLLIIICFFSYFCPEAIVFVRHVRRFYKNTLKSQTTKGPGSIIDITSLTPEVPDRKDMARIDHFLANSGVIGVEKVETEFRIILPKYTCVTKELCECKTSAIC